MWRVELLSGKGRGSRQARIELVEARTLSELPEEFKSQILNQCRRIITILENQDTSGGARP